MTTTDYSQDYAAFRQAILNTGKYKMTPDGTSALWDYYSDSERCKGGFASFNPYDWTEYGMEDIWHEFESLFILCGIDEKDYEGQVDLLWDLTEIVWLRFPSDEEPPEESILLVKTSRFDMDHAH